LSGSRQGNRFWVRIRKVDNKVVPVQGGIRLIANIDIACHHGYGRTVKLKEVVMNVSLTPELEKFVSAKVSTGRYNSASEVVREALRLLEENDRVRAQQLKEFNRELGDRLAALDRGEKVNPEVTRARLQNNSRQRRKA
jgi:antitoxin ParD1/3/4